MRKATFAAAMLVCVCFACLTENRALLALAAPPPARGVPERQADGILLAVGDAWLRVALCGDAIVRVSYAKDRAFATRPSLIVEPQRCSAPPKWTLATSARAATVSTSRLTVRVDRASGAVAFLDAKGLPILREKSGGRAMEAAEVEGEQTQHVGQQWEPQADEALYGLGQHQLGLLNIKGYDLDLWQHNTTVAVPFFVSSRGYGILWDNTSYTRFGDLREPEAVPAAQLFDASGHPGGLTGSYFAGAAFEKLVATRVDPRIDIDLPDGTREANQRIHPDLPATGNISVRWEGQIEPRATGDHVFRTFSNTGIKLWLDDRLVIDHWRQSWLPWHDVARVRLSAGQRYRVKLEWTRDQGGIAAMRFLWKTPATAASARVPGPGPAPAPGVAAHAAPGPATSLWSEVGDGIDYYFVYGPELDAVIGGYRRITGDAPMLPRWTFGLFQSRERYKTAQESLDVLAGFRSRNIPLDTIVQDWFYWKEAEWGSHQFDPARFPDPDAWIRAIHDTYHARLLISVWGKFYPGTANFDAMRAGGFLFEPNLREGLHDWINHPYTFYDPFSEGARSLFWSQVERELFSKHADAWWMDATEPDLMPTPTLDGQRSHAHPTALGTGARVLNGYALMNSKGVYEGQRGAAPDQRVFILTRSAFAGQQRFAAATWSGDISSTWTALRAQIPAGLSFSLSGLPYWTMDVGGFSVPPRFSRERQTPEDADEWRELNTRWFQFGTFSPLLRVHGQFPFREMWQLGGESDPAYQVERMFDRLRYRLLPYIYSLAGDVTQHAGTPMRALVMDFRTDAQARDVRDEYMFGPAFLVSPVTAYKARSRAVYLPRTTGGWFDFWTGRAVAGGQRIDAAAPFETLPVHVRAGSIIPTGPELQYTNEKPPDPITLYVYTGADGAFTLYEDDGETYAYERGASARIPIRWNDARRTLTIGARDGTFPGMVAERTFQVVMVSKSKPVGFSFTPAAAATLAYRGQAMTKRFP
jgi:alpha-D-xyloside xylohydrolase